MTESAKTLSFLIAGAAALLVGFVAGPKRDNFKVESLVGMKLNDFDIDAPKSLKIVKFDSDTATAHEFEVAEENGLWAIPSKQGYPADATRQMAEAATCLMDREILRIAATNASEHKALGVIDPTSANIDSESSGVGIRVTMQDNNKKDLTDMIVGKKVKDEEGQYYVRKSNQDVVYVVKLDPDKLSTKFEDWIEDDLLKLNTFDISRVEIKDYSAELGFSLSGIQVGWDRRAEMVLEYDNSGSKWSAESLKKFDSASKNFVDYTMAEDEQLDEEVLTDLRNGLDDLKIVDVERKPAGLSADLKAGEDFLKDRDAAMSLISRGFAPVPLGPDRKPEILSTEGEVICSLDTGVEYVLRFGNLQMEGGADETAPEEGAASSDDAGINRYLFVMARFNKDLIKKPEIDELPTLPAGMTEEDVQAAEQEKEADTAEANKEEAASVGAAEGTTESASADAGQSDEGVEVEEENEEEEETPTPETEAELDQEEDAAEPASFDNETPDAETPDTETPDTETPDAESSDQTDTEEQPAAEDADVSAEAPAQEATAEQEEDDLGKIIAERKRIEKENQRRLDEYQKQIEDGNQKVDELNERFGDWYYVISNEVYQQVHLNLDKLIEKKETKDEAKEGEEKAQEDTGVSGLPNLDFGGAAPAEQ